jgi:hypothetical protein
MIDEASRPSHGTMEGALITQTIIGIILLALLWGLSVICSCYDIDPGTKW